MEEPLTGFDYEAGVRIPWVSNYVETWAYAGGYHFFGRYVPDVNGVSARIEAMPTDFLTVNFEYRNDNVNHDEYYGEVAFEVPFSIENLVTGRNPFEGIGDVLTGSRTLKERMVEPVRRDVDIVVGKETLSPAESSRGRPRRGHHLRLGRRHRPRATAPTRTPTMISRLPRPTRASASRPASST